MLNYENCSFNFLHRTDARISKFYLINAYYICYVVEKFLVIPDLAGINPSKQQDLWNLFLTAMPTCFHCA